MRDWRDHRNRESRRAASSQNIDLEQAPTASNVVRPNVYATANASADSNSAPGLSVARGLDDEIPSPLSRSPPTVDVSDSSSSESDEPQINPIEIAQRYEVLQNLRATSGGDDDDDDDDDDNDGEDPWEDDDRDTEEGPDPDTGSSTDVPDAQSRRPLPPSALPTPPSTTDDPSQVPLSFCTSIQPDENLSDPFHEHTTYAAPPLIESAHEYRAVQIIYLLVMWLHSQFHVPIRALAAILGVFRLVVISLGLDVQEGMATTYKTVQSHMKLEPKFSVLPVCVKCLEPHPADYQQPTCQKCGFPLFLANAKSKKKGKRTSKKASRPKLQFPYKSISDQLPKLLSLHGLEDILDSWRTRTREPGVMNDIFDGNIAKNVLGPDGRPFFRHNESGKTGPDGELRIGLTLGVDWYDTVAFTPTLLF